MKSDRIVKSFDVYKDIRTSLSSAGILLKVDPLAFYGGEETFHHGVVVAVSGAAHANRIWLWSISFEFAH